jgi:geranylgeranyl diphosphate synthase type II
MNNVVVSLASDGVVNMSTKVPASLDSLAHKQFLIESALDSYTQFDEHCPTKLKEAIRYSLLTRGKRLRPMLVMLAAEACGGSAEAAVPCACAVEMMHTYSLIHDDLPCMDNDDLRRGRPTSHKVFGEAIAILAGDALIALAFEVITRDIRPWKTAAQCVATLAHATGPSALVGGQCDDICQKVTTGSREALDSIHNRKTGALFLASLRLGGFVAAADESQHRALETYGANLGLAFQITDDLLDYQNNGSLSARAKHKGSDAGKLTFPNLIGVQNSRDEVQRLIETACNALAPLGNHAGSLKALASFVSDRS